MKSTIIFLSILCVLLATTGIIGAKALYDKANTSEYKIVRDTVLIDPSRQLSGDCGEYQIELQPDSIHVYDGQRLVSVQHYDNSNVDSVLIADNE